MNKFGEFLYSLRKEKGMTQMELADKLGITNKAVSKWETGEAFPETGQLVPLATIFDITVDELLRGERNANIVVEEQATIEEPETVIPPLKPMTKAEAYTTAGAIALILIGVLVLVSLAVNNISHGIYVSLLLFCTAIAVVLLVFTSLRRKVRSAELSEENYQKGKKLAIMLSLSVGIIIASVIPLVALSAYDISAAIFLPVFFAVLIIGITLVVFSGIQWEAFNKVNPLPEDEVPVTTKQTEKFKGIEDAVCGTIMLIATAVFLILGFLYNRWHPGWVVFPIAGILCGIISSIVKVLNK
ncbi:MAG: helix-turn-helix transcriptional regulator [Clostridia bacterium]|nr:helix-turn-helix transcriptional regulator [Clostridia bacterium]